MRYEVAFYDAANNAPVGRLRFGMPSSENDAAHLALKCANEAQSDMCVVEERTAEVVQVIRYRPTL